MAAVCGAAKKLGANEEICKELADEGAVQATMQVAPLHAHGGLYRDTRVEGLYEYFGGGSLSWYMGLFIGAWVCELGNKDKPRFHLPS